MIARTVLLVLAVPAHFPPLSVVEARKLQTTVAIGAGRLLFGTFNPPPP